MTDEDKKLIFKFCKVEPEYVSVPDPLDYPKHKLLRSDPRYPPLNPNFYSKYVVPKMDRVSIYINNEYQGRKRNKVRILYQHSFYDGSDSDLVEAFGQALLELIKGEK